MKIGLILPIDLGKTFLEVQQMGEYGSGRSGFKGLTARKLALDIRTLKRKDRLVPGQTFSWSWKRSDGQDAGNINISTGNDILNLSYRYKYGEDEWKTLEMSIEIDWTRCNFGGKRPWFLCPRCGIRVAILYGGKYFYCRICHNLAYPSENETQIDRLFRKARKLRERLEATSDMTLPINFKPKGMHWDTFVRLLGESQHIEMQIYNEMDRQLGIIL